MDKNGFGGPYAEAFLEQLGQWSDERFMSRADIRTLFFFTEYIVNLADAGGWTYSGHSFKQGTPLGVLVIKAVLSDSYVVSFISGRTFLNCAKIFLRRLEEDTVEWRPDKYRG